MECSTGSFKAGENRDGCADRRRESPSTHLIERRIELKVRIVIITTTTQISHYSYLGEVVNWPQYTATNQWYRD